MLKETLVRSTQSNIREEIEYIMTETEMKAMERSVRHRIPDFGEAGTVEYVVGETSFQIRLNPRKVFPPSETTIALADIAYRQVFGRALDVGTGSGLLALALAKCGSGKVTAIDLNSDAVQSAEANAKRNGLAGKIRFECVDFLNWDPPHLFDLIVSNPPFMPMPGGSSIISNEIMRAIYGGVDGSVMVKAFAKKASTSLTADGRYIFGLPRFVDTESVFDFLSDMFSVKVIAKAKIRFWLAEHGRRFSDHILHLARTTASESSQEGEALVSPLEIVECTQSAQLSRG